MVEFALFLCKDQDLQQQSLTHQLKLQLDCHVTKDQSKLLRSTMQNIINLKNTKVISKELTQSTFFHLFQLHTRQSNNTFITLFLLFGLGNIALIMETSSN